MVKLMSNLFKMKSSQHSPSECFHLLPLQQILVAVREGHSSEACLVAESQQLLLENLRDVRLGLERNVRVVGVQRNCDGPVFQLESHIRADADDLFPTACVQAEKEDELSVN